MDTHIATYLHARVPRYTSYPTAPHFSPAVGEVEVRSWLAALPDGAQLSLYLHIPFCSQMCWYCGCNMKLAARYGPVAAYVSRLVEEIGFLADALPRRHRVSYIHWGGGTPTSLIPADFERIDTALRGCFEIEPDAEIAVEIDPRTLTLERAEALARIGCNRASLGVQEFDEKVQQAINRVQPFEQVARVTRLLRDHGISAINFDLMYGLPEQTFTKLENTVRRAVSLSPNRIALFGYAHVPWMAKNQRLIEESALPDAAARFEMSEAAADLIESLGYRRVGIDHFALPADSLSRAARSGRLRRNFQGYTTDDSDALIGIGASSISAFPQGYAQNIVETGAYMRALAERRLPIAKGLCLSRTDSLRRDIIERIMCDFAVDVAAVCARHETPESDLQPAMNGLQPYVAAGLVAQESSMLRITKRGRPLTRIIAAAFDAYLDENAAGLRHPKL